MPGCGAALRAAIDRRWPGVRTSVVARTRLIDDTLGDLPDEQLGQVVILGAGFDSRPYRLGRLQGGSIFEVDHPATQEVKRHALLRALGSLPTNVTFVPSDFNSHDLGPAMAAAGYSKATPTMLLWEGVTNYLDEGAVDATVCWCADAAPGSLLLFTYVHSYVLTHPERFARAARLHATLQKVDERLTFGMDPDSMSDFLAQRGLDRQRDLGAADYRARYFGPRAQAMVGHEFYRVALARIGTS